LINSVIICVGNNLLTGRGPENSSRASGKAKLSERKIVKVNVRTKITSM